MRVSVLQFQPNLLKKRDNQSRLRHLLSSLDSDLVVLPELATSGYVFETTQEVLSVAEEAGKGDSFELFGALAKERNCSIVFGFPELGYPMLQPSQLSQHSSSSFLHSSSSFLRKQESPAPSEEKNTPKLYNSCALINPDGSWYVYRKTHLFYREKLFFSPGDSGFLVCEAKGGVKIGMMICFDWQFPEAARSLALKGAQLICHPSNLVLPWCQQAMKTRSLENRVFSLTSNRTGKEGKGENELKFTGASQILSPKGELLASLSTTEEGIATVEIEPSEADNKQVTKLNNAFADRRPDLYNL